MRQLAAGPCHPRPGERHGLQHGVQGGEERGQHQPHGPVDGEVMGREEHQWDRRLQNHPHPGAAGGQ